MTLLSGFHKISRHSEEFSLYLEAGLLRSQRGLLMRRLMLLCRQLLRQLRIELRCGRKLTRVCGCRRRRSGRWRLPSGGGGRRLQTGSSCQLLVVQGVRRFRSRKIVDEFEFLSNGL